MKPLPDGLAPYKRTPVFTENTVPASLLKDHKTKAGVWGVIHVKLGRLRYVIPSYQYDVVLSPEKDGIMQRVSRIGSPPGVGRHHWLEKPQLPRGGRETRPPQGFRRSYSAACGADCLLKASLIP